jgi:hypothetical protein
LPGRRKILFTDWRDIACGHLAWLTPEGRQYGVGHPPEPQVEMHARPICVPHGVRLVAQPARKTEPIAGWRGWGRTIHDQGRYRSWFLEVEGNAKLGSGSTAETPEPRSLAVCYVESADGFNWTEPQRCPIELPGQTGFDGLTFFVDPVAPPQERYKFVYCASPPQEVTDRLFEKYRKRPARYQDERVMGGGRWCLFYLTSPDGLQWTPVREPMMMHPSDTDTTVYWDAALGKYVMFTRMFRQQRRWIGRAEADDLHHWGPIEPIIWPRLDDPPDYDFYLNGRTEYPGLPEYHIMFPMVWHRFTERSELRLYSSADGIAWSQVPGGPVLTPGEPGAWDSEFIGCGKDLMPFGESRIAIPYTGTPYPHKYPRWPAVWDAWQMAWAWWPEDRLCALRADHEGEFCTMPLAPAGKALRLNLRTPRAGEVRVEVMGAAGRALEDCDPVHGDHAAHTVTWRGESSLGITDDRPVTLRFRLRCAELFALEWA